MCFLLFVFSVFLLNVFGMVGFVFLFFFGVFSEFLKQFKILLQSFARITIFRSSPVKNSPGFFNDICNTC